MKKILKLLFTTFCLSLLFTSCYDAVFFEINNDVPPETATVSGNITAITRYTVDGKEFLVVSADGGIRYKYTDNQTHGSWYTLDSKTLPFESHYYYYYTSEHKGEQIIKVLSDSTNLYLVTATYEDDDSLGTTKVKAIKIWTNTFSLDSEGEWTANGEWNCIVDEASSPTYFKFYEYRHYQYSAFAIFQSNSPITANRCVYIRSGNANASDNSVQAVSYFQINKGTISSVKISPIDLVDDDLSNISSVAVLNGTPVFFNTIASTTNETYNTPATRIYFSRHDELYYTDENNAGTYHYALDAGKTISSIATCNDSILIGRADYSSTSTTAYGGIVKTSLVDGVPGTSLLDFETNANFQLSSSYLINTLLNATPENNEKESSLYSSISFFGNGSSISVSYDSVGLWSYYPKRGNWNRE